MCCSPSPVSPLSPGAAGLATRSHRTPASLKTTAEGGSKQEWAEQSQNHLEKVPPPEADAFGTGSTSLCQDSGATSQGSKARGLGEAASTRLGTTSTAGSRCAKRQQNEQIQRFILKTSSLQGSGFRSVATGLAPLLPHRTCVSGSILSIRGTIRGRAVSLRCHSAPGSGLYPDQS